MGKKIIKFLAVIVVIVVVIITGLAVFIKIYVTPERIKSILVPQAEKALNRKVTVGEVDISVLKGISVTDFAVKETDEKTNFISCKDFVLKFKLLPLLSKQVIIDELRLVAPKIRIERNALGKFNFDDIGKEKTERATEKKTEEGTGGMPVSLLVSNVSVTDASISVIDHLRDIPDIKGSLSIETTMRQSAGGELLSEGTIDLILQEMTRWKPRKSTIKDLTAGIQYQARINPDTGEVDIKDAGLKVQDVQAAVRGKTKNLTTSPEIDIKLSMKKVDTADVMALLSRFVDLKGLALSGSFSTDVNVKGMPQKIDSLISDGTITIEKAGITYNKISTVLGGTIELRTSSDNLTVERAELTVQEIPVVLKGTVKGLSTAPLLDIAVSVPRVAAETLQRAAAPFTNLMGIAVSGALKADMKIKGAVKDLSAMKATGSLDLEKIGIKYQDIDAVLDGALVLKEDLMNIDLNTSVGENRTTLKGSIKNLFKNQDINLNIYSDSLNLEKLVPPVREKAEPASAARETATETSTGEAGPLDTKFTARGEIKVNSALYRGLTMKNLDVKYEFSNNKLKVTTLTGSAGKGTFDLISSADLSKKGYLYSLSGKIDSLYAEEIINAFFPKYKDTVYGVVSTNIKASGKGTLPESIKQNITGNVDFTIRDGKITNIPMLSNLAAILNTRELETINIKKGNGTVSLANGHARLDSLLTSNEIELDPKGDIGMIDESLDLAFDLRLSPRLKGKAMSSSYSEYLADQAGWGMIPVKCQGTFSKPQCGPDLAKAGKRAVEKEIGRQIDKLLKKKEGEESPETEAVKELLKGIFNK